MECDTYTVLVNDVVVAEKMSIDNAVIFIKALFIQFPDDYNMKISLRKDTDLPCKVADDEGRY